MQNRKPNTNFKEHHPLLAVVPNNKSTKVVLKQLISKAIPLTFKLFFQEKQVGVNPQKTQGLRFVTAVHWGNKKQAEFGNFLTANQKIKSVDKEVQEQNRKFTRHIAPYRNRINPFSLPLIAIGVLKSKIGGVCEDKISNRKAKLCTKVAIQAGLLPFELPLLFAKGITGLGIKGVIKASKIGMTGFSHIGKYGI